MKHSKLNAPHPWSAAGFAQPAGFGGAKQCFAKLRLRARPGAGLPMKPLRSKTDSIAGALLRMAGSIRSIVVGRSRTRFTLVCLLTSLASSLALAGVKIEHWVAASGAKVYFIETRVLPILDVQIDFAAGAAFVPAAKSGLDSLTQGLLESGAGDLDEEQIAGRLVDIAARLGGGADSDRASVGLRILSARPQREAALDLMRTVLSAPTFPQAVLEREKGRTIASIREAETRPDAIAAKRFAAAIYPDHPYGVSPTVASVGAVTR